jgi:CheY-like chemotaxis protein
MATKAKRILLVDDDPLLLRLYREGLSQRGDQVDVAIDGVAAVNALRAAKPDVVVLDLVMPRFTGVDVLKFIRSQPDLAKIPVIVLSTSYMNELAGQAVRLGVQKALLKVRCSPVVLLDIISDICAGQPTREDPSNLLAVPRKDQPKATPASPPPAAAPNPSKEPRSHQPTADQGPAAEFQAKARTCLFDAAPVTCAALRGFCQSIASAASPAQRDASLEDLGRKVHFIATTASLAECHHLAQMAGALEAFVVELAHKPAGFTASTTRTLATAVDLLNLLFDHARTSVAAPLQPAHVLVVDDDKLSNRLVVTALRHAAIQAQSSEDPVLALEWLQQKRYDLVLLDIEMPGMNGFEFCRRLRLVPGYEQTPVIYVTAHANFDNRAKSILSGGGDLVSKPISPTELAVKALLHLLRNQLNL